jgi:DNA-binding NtrC family response regulator
VTRSRILPWLGPLAALYFVAGIASVAGGLSLGGLYVAVVAVACTLAPILTRSDEEAPGARRVGWLGMAAGFALLAAVDGRAEIFPVDVASRSGAALAGALVLDLAMTVPRAGALRRSWRAVIGPLAVAAGAAGVLAAAPTFEVRGVLVLVPVRLGQAPLTFVVAASALALALRVWRRRGTHDLLALASNAWAILGLAPAVLAAAVAYGLSTAGEGEWARVLAGTAALGALLGHIALVDPTRRPHADAGARKVAAAAVAVVAVGTVGGLVAPWLPATRTAVALAVGAGAVLAALLHRLLQPAARFIFARDGARLLRAIERIEAELLDVRSFQDLGRTVLGPLRDASRRPDAMPMLYVNEPPLEIRLDAAREAHVRERAMPPTLLGRLLERPADVVVRGALEGQVVRRPELRSLVEVMASVDALCVVPLHAGGEVEGAVMVPQGQRRSLPSLEELHALERLGNDLTSLVVLLGAQERARRRTAEAMRERDAAEERIEALEDEVDRMRTEASALRAGRGASRLRAPPVAYGPSMRSLQERIRQVAPLEAPVLLVAEGGTPVDQVALWLHDASARNEGPFVVADCASVRPEQALAALLGTEGERAEPGWLRVASGGTLLLVDVPALPLESQAALAEAMSTRRAAPTGAAGAFPVDVRVVATSRVELAPLVRGGAFDPELSRWLGRLRLEVPPLRARREDIPSLSLLALDRACRVLGREVMGMDQRALEILLAHDWPGNLRELQHVVGLAVARAEGPQVRPSDIPPLAASAPTGDPMAGTYDALEKQILLHALDRAGGNKSKAARLLGLKRTTFLDKLRRHDLDEPPSKGAEHAG